MTDDFETTKKLEETYSIHPPLEHSDQLGLLFMYRRALAHILVLNGIIDQKERHINELDKMIQEWIIANPTRNKDH